MPPSNDDPQSNPFHWKWVLAGAMISLLGWGLTRAFEDVGGRIRAQTANYGYTPNPDGVRQFLGELEQPTFREAGEEVILKARGVDTFPYRAAIKAHQAVYQKPFGPLNQGEAGTCVSMGWAMGSYVGQCVDWTQGRLAQPPPMVATEPIYGGSRTAARLPPISVNSGGDGSYGAAAARWVSGLKNGQGGILYRQKYGDLDLTLYSIPLSREWGRNGVPVFLAKQANEHKAQKVALIETWEGLCASLESGYCVPICSNVGFARTNVRDQDGFLPRGGTWSHCMVCVAVRYAKNDGKRDGILVMNSWGKSWVTGPKWPSDQPDGSFWMSKEDAISIISQGDSFAIGGVDGFVYRDLNHFDWMRSDPAAASLAF
jgi:hypothetical protein